MSRLGKKPISIPAGVEAKIDQNQIIVKGPKGETRQTIHPSVVINFENNALAISVKEPEKKSRKLFGGRSFG